MLAYDVEPLGRPIPVTVTIATEQGWSLVGVMASAELSPAAAIALISSRGLDAALRPLAPGSSGATRLEWHGKRRPKPTKRRRKGQR